MRALGSWIAALSLVLLAMATVADADCVAGRRVPPIPPPPADQCLMLAGVQTADVDHDGFGDLCDGDYDQDCRVGIPDFAIFRAAFGSVQGGANWNPLVDSDSDGVISSADLIRFGEHFESTPDTAENVQ